MQCEVVISVPSIHVSYSSSSYIAKGNLLHKVTFIMYVQLASTIHLDFVVVGHSAMADLYL